MSLNDINLTPTDSINDNINLHIQREGDLPLKNKCKRCFYVWKPFVKAPQHCPLCKSQYWNMARTKKTGIKAKPAWQRKGKVQA